MIMIDLFVRRLVLMHAILEVLLGVVDQDPIAPIYYVYGGKITL